MPVVHRPMTCTGVLHRSGHGDSRVRSGLQGCGMTTIKVGSPGEFLTSLPYQLGYHPRRSLVLVAMRGSVVLAIARVALPDPAPSVRQGQVLQDAAATVVRPLVLGAADAVYLIGYEDALGESDDIAVAVLACCRAHGLQVRCRLRVHDGRFWVGDADDTAWPGPALAMPDPSRVPAVADFVALGVLPAMDRDALAELVACEGSVRSKQVATALTTLRTRRRRTMTVEAACRAWRAVFVEHAGSLDDPLPMAMPLAPRDVAEAAAALLDVHWRDALLAWLCPGSLPAHSLPKGYRGALFGVPRLAPRRRSDRTSGAGPGTPTVSEEVHARQVIARLHELARALPDTAGEAAAAVLTVDAHVLWWHGDGAMSSVALERALRISPDYTLAQLLDRIVGVGIRPGGAA